MKKFLVWSLLAIAIGGALFLIPTIWFKPWSINHFYARTFLRFAIRHPMLLSQLRILEPMGIEFHANDLDDVSVEFQLEEARWAASQLDILQSYDRDSLDAAGKLSYDILEWFLIDSVEGNRFLFHNYPVNQLFGVQSELPDFMINVHQIDSPGSAQTFIVRLNQFGRYLDQTIRGLQYREERGIVPPKFVLDKVLEGMRRFRAPEPKENVLFVHFQGKVASIEQVDDARRARFLADAEQAVETTVYPAYDRLIAEAERLQLVATTDDGVWKLPNGGDFYAYQLRHYTTTGMSADEIHALGLEEVETIQAEMSSILESVGLGTSDVGHAMTVLGDDSRFLYPDTDEGRRQILDDYQTIIDDVGRGLSPIFNVIPGAAVKVEPIPSFKQATSTVAYYNAPPFDGSKPGIFYVNLRSVREHPKFGMRTLAYHEAVPGHHFQIAIAQELKEVPFFRRVIPFTAFVEGWALYAEKLAAERRFEDDPYDRLGYLQAQLFRAVRLVVDTGIHSKRWTREEAIDYMLQNTGMAETDVVAEIERYIVNPGQACAYKVGQLEILKLRTRAQERLGDRFDIREFHDVVLTNGAVPLVILERLVDQWIESVESVSNQ